MAATVAPVRVGAGDFVMADCGAGVWRAGEIVSDTNQLQVRYEDGSFDLLRQRIFTVQTPAGCVEVSTLQDVLVPAPDVGPACWRTGVVTELHVEEGAADVVVGVEGVDFTWMAAEDGSSVALSIKDDAMKQRVSLFALRQQLDWLKLYAGDNCRELGIADQVLALGGPGGPLRTHVPGTKAGYNWLRSQDVLCGLVSIFDVDGDGALSVSEMAAFIAAARGVSSGAGEGVTEEEATEAMEKMAEDGDASLTDAGALPITAVVAAWVAAHERGEVTLLRDAAALLVLPTGVLTSDGEEMQAALGKTDSPLLEKVVKSASAVMRVAQKPGMTERIGSALLGLQQLCKSGAVLSAEAMQLLRDSVAAAVRRAPALLMALGEAVQAAIAALPAVAAALSELWTTVMAGAGELLAAAGDAAAIALTEGIAFGSRLFALARDAAAQGAAMAPAVLAQLKAALLSGKQLSEELLSSLAAQVAVMARYVSAAVMNALASSVPAALAAVRDAISSGIAAGKEAAAELAGVAAAALDDGGDAAVDGDAASAAASAAGAAAKAVMTMLAHARAAGAELAEEACAELTAALLAGKGIAEEMADSAQQLFRAAAAQCNAAQLARVWAAVRAAVDAGLDAWRSVAAALAEAAAFVGAAGRILLSPEGRAAMAAGARAAGRAAVEAAKLGGAALLSAAKAARAEGAAIADALLPALADAARTGAELAEESVAALREAAPGMLAALSDEAAAALQAATAAAAEIGLAGYAAVAEAVAAAYGELLVAGKQLLPVVLPAARAAAAAATAAGVAIGEVAGHAAAAVAAAGGAALEAAGLDDEAAAAAAAVREAAGQAGDAARQAGAAVREVAGDAGDIAREAAGEVAAVGREIGEFGVAAGGIVVAEAQAALLAGMEEAKDAAAWTAAAGADFFESVDLRAGLGDAWGALDDAYTVSRDAAKAALIAAAGVAAAVFDFVNFDIVRDFFQTAGLYFSQLGANALAGAKALWGNISGIIALDFTFVFNVPPEIWVPVLIVAGIIALIGLLCVLRQSFKLLPDAIRDGHEVRDWETLREEASKTTKAIQITLTVLTSLYLPLSRSSLVLLRDGVPAGQEALLLVAGLVTVIVTIGLPIFCAYMINRSKPVGSLENPDITHDEDGMEVPYTDEMYDLDVNTDPNQVNCPYQFLYKGYERRWAFYKVAVMVLKLALVLPAIMLPSTTSRTIGTLVVLAIYTALSTLTRPFIKSSSDIMDGSGRVTALVTVVCALIAEEANAAGPAMNVIVNIANTVNAVVMIIVALAVLPPVALWIKNKLGRFTFSDSVRDDAGPADRIIPRWNLAKEVRHRVWHPFWSGLLLKRCGEEVAERMAHLLRMTREHGLHHIKAHFCDGADGGIVAMRKGLAAEVEGIDVYYDGPVHDGHLDSDSKFGKMYLVPYPFHAVMVYDGCDDYAFVHDSDALAGMLAAMRTPDIRARVQLRQQLRAAGGMLMHREMERDERHTLQDGTSTDAEGNTHPVYSTVTVHMYYHNGTLGVSADRDRPMAAGFNVSMQYNDGHGIAHLPRTGERKEVHGSCCISAGELGLGPEMQLTPSLSSWFMAAENRCKWEGGVAAVQQAATDYRVDISQQREADEQLLSSSFWYFIYNNDRASREAVQSYFRNVETNPTLRSVPDEHAAGLDFLYSRLAYLRSHPVTTLWWLTWSDLWEQNHKMKILDGLREQLDPSYSSALAYHPCERDELEGKLTEMGIRHPKKFVNDKTMDLLYAEMARLNEEYKAA
eukprot:PLAT6443.10.p1 GENE.PLAT6443.10~~PLAT6443.10.p1  ORF type:complete len:1759 (+),score=1054.57 PLAT6443.10:35-5311(+)